MKNYLMRHAFCLSLLITLVLTITSFPSLIIPSTTSTQVTIPHNEQIQLYFTDEAASVTNYTDDTNEPGGWELFPSIFWDSNTNGIFEDNESIGHTLSPCIHFTHEGEQHHFWPLHQSIMQDPGDPNVTYSGWTSYPNIYKSIVEDTNQLLTIGCTTTVIDGESYFSQEVEVTSTAASTLSNLSLIIYVGFDVNGYFADQAFIDTDNHNMLKAYDNTTEIWFGAYPENTPQSYEISEWNDGPYEMDDLWQHVLDNNLEGITASSGDIEGALQFYITDLQPSQNRSSTIYYSFGKDESELYIPTGPEHDVAIIDLTTSKTVVGQGYPVEINVTADNQGDLTETFNITIYGDKNISIIGDEIIIGNHTIASLPNGTTTTFTLIWNTTGVDKGNYTISAYAWPIPNEVDIADNMYSSSEICVTIPGDMDTDHDVDIFDIVLIAGRYGSKKGDPEFHSNYDIDGDWDIDIFDIVIAAVNYGQSW